MLLDRGADTSINSNDKVSLNLAAILGPVHASSPFAVLIKHGMPLKDDAIAQIGTFRMEIFEKAFDLLKSFEGLRIEPAAKFKLLNLAQEMGSIRKAVELASPSLETDEIFLEGIIYAIEFDLHTQFHEYVRDPRFTVDMADSEVELFFT